MSRINEKPTQKVMLDNLFCKIINYVFTKAELVKS